LQDTYHTLSAATGDEFLGMPFVCLSCHSVLGHLELVNTSMTKRTRTDVWKNAAFFAQVISTTATNTVTGGREYTITDATGEYRLNTTSGNKTARQPNPGESSIVPPAFFLTGETPKTGETRRQAYARILTAHPQFARATVNYVWKAIFGIGIVEPADSFDLLRQDPATQATGVAASIPVTGASNVPHAMQLPDPTEGGAFRTFLNSFGRGNRDDAGRTDDTSITQALSLLNDRNVTDRVKSTAVGSKLGA